MATIKRSDVIQKAVNDLAISSSMDKIPSETLDKVQLTYSLNKQYSSFIISGGQTTTGTITVTYPAVSAGSETYLTSISSSYVKDATCDVASGTLLVQAIPDSAQQTPVLRQAVLTLTAQSDTSVITFPYPLKVRNNNSIAYTGAFTAGAMSRGLTATGFTTSSN